MNVNIKKLHPDAIIPKYSKPGDAGLDLTAVSIEYDSIHNCIVYDTGLGFEIPEGFVGLVFPRSSVSNMDIVLSNCVGVIDSGYRGSVKAKFKLVSGFWCEGAPLETFKQHLEKGEFMHYESAKDEFRDNGVLTDIYKPGDRIAQLIIMPYPQINLVEVQELSSSERGTGGYGSTGK